MPGRLYTRSVQTLPPVPATRRDEILAASRSRAENAALEADLGIFDCVEVVDPPRPGSEPESLRIAAWNLERGRYTSEAVKRLTSAQADVALLTELDVGMARTGQRHTARSLASALGHGLVYAVEFLELGLGDPEERARHAGAANDAGLHGGAITSAWPIARPAVLRLDAGGDWLDGQRGEPRVGGRIAIFGTLPVGRVDVAVAAVHLESHSDPAHRAEQMQVLLEALDAYAGGGPAVIGGDLNTLSLPSADLADPRRLGDALRDDPTRLLHPERHEPLFGLAKNAGYDWTMSNATGLGSVRRAEADGSRRVPVRLDWVLVRGVGCSGPAVIAATDDGGRAISDHELLAVTIRPEPPSA